MKAAVYYETGAPSVFRYEDVPDPPCHPRGRPHFVGEGREPHHRGCPTSQTPNHLIEGEPFEPSVDHRDLHRRVAAHHRCEVCEPDASEIGLVELIDAKP